MYNLLIYLWGILMNEVQDIYEYKEKNRTKDMKYYEWLRMRNISIVGILIYYLLLFISSILLVFWQYPDRLSIDFNLLLFGSLFCLLSCLIYYIRKMYKHLIRGEVTVIKKKDQFSVEEIGTLAYFLLRPLMAVVFGAITFFILEVFIRLTVSSGSGYSEGYILLVAIIEFLGGFSVGRFIENLEQVAKRVVDNLFKKLGE